MAFTLNKNDERLLRDLAEFRVLTVSQVAALTRRARRSARRRLSGLADEKLVTISERTFGTGPGRPEGLVSLSTRGIATLRKDGALSCANDDHVLGDGFRPLEHQLLVNWFRIHLIEVERAASHLRVRFLSPTSPFLERAPDGEPLVMDHVDLNPPSQARAAFTPDGVFSITASDQGRTVLFFLEADRGTESLTSSRAGAGDIRKKLETYQAYFRTGGYKRYEEHWGCHLAGFRLLIFTNGAARLGALCRLVQESPPFDFVWLTDKGQLFEFGAGAEIWTRGGNRDKPRRSILGSRACTAPLPLNT